ncbi:hypothetical protein [Kribbella swartbergensis]
MVDTLPPIERLGNGQVLLRSRALVDVCRLALAGARQAERQDGIGLSAGTRALLAALCAEAEQVLSATADVRADDRADLPESAAMPASVAIDTEEVARMLHMSTRHVRRIAPSLGGRRVDGHWQFDRTELALILAQRNESEVA